MIVNSPNNENWLDALLPVIQGHVTSHPILELGCGPGVDTATLSQAGFSVIALDRSSAALAYARVNASRAIFFEQDIRSNFPPATLGTGVVLASLSLHYFSWDETVAIVERIHETLAEQGILVCRLNSTNDHHHGASGYPQIAEDFFLVEVEPKRFFTRDACEALFNRGWRILALDEKVIHRYEHPKSVWEIVVEKAGS